MEQTVQKQRVAAYCRVSTDNADHFAGCAVQEAYYTEMIGKRPDWELAGIYADNGIAGTDRKKQKEFNKMLTACKQGKIDIILVRSVSRFARNMADCVETMRMLKASGVRVIFEKEGIDTGAESDELLTTLFYEFAQREAESIAQKHGHPMIFPCRYGCIHAAGQKG